MRTTRQLSITLPNEMADALRERVQSGEYASESEVIREGLRALWARDQAVDRWLRGEVAEAYDALVVDPLAARTPTNCERVSPLSGLQHSDVPCGLHARGGGPPPRSLPLHRRCRLARHRGGLRRRSHHILEGLTEFPHRGLARDDIRPGLRTTSYKKKTVVAFTVFGDASPSSGSSTAAVTTEAILRDTSP